MKRLVLIVLIALLGWNAYQRFGKTGAEPDGLPSSFAGNLNTPSAASTSFKCDGRVYCSQMTSCAEATYFLKNCPGTKMDGNNDGVPCEKQWCR